MQVAYLPKWLPKLWQDYFIPWVVCYVSLTCCIVCLYAFRVMLLAVLCLVAMVENQNNQHISKMWQHHHTKVMISNNRINWAPVSGNNDSLLSAHRTRVILHFVRDSMRHSGNANWQTVRNLGRCKLILNGFSPVLFLSPWSIGGSFPKYLLFSEHHF